MNEQSFSQTNQPVQSSKNIWTIIASITMTALIVGGGVYAWQRSSLKSSEQNLQQQIATLESQIKLLQQSANQDNNDIPPLTNEDSNEVETVSDLTSLDQTWDLYTNHKYGFSIKVPKKCFLAMV